MRAEKNDDVHVKRENDVLRLPVLSWTIGILYEGSMFSDGICF